MLKRTLIHSRSIMNLNAQKFTIFSTFTIYSQFFERLYVKIGNKCPKVEKFGQYCAQKPAKFRLYRKGNPLKCWQLLFK